MLINETTKKILKHKHFQNNYKKVLENIKKQILKRVIILYKK